MQPTLQYDEVKMDKNHTFNMDHISNNRPNGSNISIAQMNKNTKATHNSAVLVFECYC